MASSLGFISRLVCCFDELLHYMEAAAIRQCTTCRKVQLKVAGSPQPLLTRGLLTYAGNVSSPTVREGLESLATMN